MPTYDYQCKACGHEFELFQQMTEPVKRKCPRCGKSALERLIGTGAGVIFKGGGFYETDYRSDSYKKAAEAEKKSAEGKSEAKSGDGAADSKSKPETKPAQTSETPSSDSAPKKESRPPIARSSSSRKSSMKRTKKK